MYLPEGVDFYKTYELFHFLQFHVTYINVPVEFEIRKDSGFGNFKLVTHREPLASWKNIPRDNIQDPVPVDRMTGQIEERMGLGQIMRVEKQRTQTPLINLGSEQDTKRTYIIEIGSEKKDKEEVHEIEVLVSRGDQKFDWEEDLRQQINIKIGHMMKSRKREWGFARYLGKTAIIQQLTMQEIRDRA